MEDDRLQSLEEFVQRTSKDEFRKEVKKETNRLMIKHNQKQRLNREKSRESIKKYAKSEKGIKNRTETALRRKNRFKQSMTLQTARDIEAIEHFYKNCPVGYCVDHIQPIAKGGKHELANLQYLTIDENFRKGNKNMQEYLEYRQICLEIDGGKIEKITDIVNQ